MEARPANNLDFPGLPVVQVMREASTYIASSTYLISALRDHQIVADFSLNTALDNAVHGKNGRMSPREVGQQRRPLSMETIC